METFQVLDAVFGGLRTDPTSATKIRDCSFSMNLEELRAPLSHRAQLQRYEDGRGPPGKGFRPGGRRSFDSWQVGVSIDSLFEYGMLFLGGKIAN